MSFNPQLADSDGSRHYPNNWPNSFVSADASRFVARFRIAKAAHISFDNGISLPVTESYQSFIKLFLAYTAFEIFLKAFHIQRDEKDNLDEQYDGFSVIAEIRDLHAQSPGFFSFIRQELDDERHLKKNMTSFIEGKHVTAISLAKSFRHIFAHGILTSSSNGSDSVVTRRIGILLYEHLMNIMNSEATRRANEMLTSAACGTP